MKRIRENPRKYMEQIQKLIKENKSLKSNNHCLTQKVERLENVLVLQVQLKQKAKYFKDKYYSALKMAEELRKEVGSNNNLEKQTGLLKEVNIHQKCSFCGEIPEKKKSIKETFEYMHGQYQIIRKFTNRRATQEKKTRKVYTIYIGDTSIKQFGKSNFSRIKGLWVSI